jgi:hypothetical protein
MNDVIYTFNIKTRAGDKKHMALLRNGAIHRYNPVTKTTPKDPVYIFAEDHWETPSGRIKTFTPARTKRMLELLDAVPKAEKEKPVKLKVAKKAKPPMSNDMANVELGVVNLGGIIHLTVKTNDSNKTKELFSKVKGLRYQPTVFYRVPITPQRVQKLNYIFDKKKAKPKYLRDVRLLLGDWRKAYLHIKDLNPKIAAEIKVLVRRRFKTTTFFMFPTIIGTKLELWTPVADKTIASKYKQILAVDLKGTKDTMFLLPFIYIAKIKGAVSALINAVKRGKGFVVTNEKEFKAQVSDLIKKAKK